MLTRTCKYLSCKAASLSKRVDSLQPHNFCSHSKTGLVKVYLRPSQKKCIPRRVNADANTFAAQCDCRFGLRFIPLLGTS